MFFRIVFALLIPVAAVAETPCEQLLLPGFEGRSVRPSPPPPARLNVGEALARGRRLSKFDDSDLVSALRAELPDGVMIGGASAATIRTAVAAGEFAGVVPTAAQIEDVHKSVDSGREFLNVRWIFGLTPYDVANDADLAARLDIPREGARLEAGGRFVLDALGMDAGAYAPWIPVLGELVSEMAPASAWAQVISGMHEPKQLDLAGRARAEHGEITEEILDDAVERRGFLLVWRRSAFARRAHTADPAGAGSIVALEPGYGLRQADLYAIIPQSNLDRADLREALAPSPAPRVSASRRSAPPAPARVVVGQPRARRS